MRGTPRNTTRVSWRAVIALACLIAGLTHVSVAAQTTEQLQKNVDAKKEEIIKLEQEAKRYRNELATRQEIGKTLQAELKRIDGVIKELRGEIAATEQKITKTSIEIDELAAEIKEKEKRIAALRQGLATLVRAFSQQEQESLLATIARNRTLSQFFNQMESLSLLKERVLNALDTLHAAKNELALKTAEAHGKKQEFETLQGSLQGRKKIQESTQVNKNDLLRLTKNQEKKYQELLVEQERKKAALAQEITRIEEQIRIQIDASLLPGKRPGVLGLPLPDATAQSCWNGGNAIKNCVTQYFGYTAFARAGGYGKNGHNGIDFRAAIGTPILAAESGVVVGTGDTDTGCYKTAYGKWILIEHPNHLSTLYGHLSVINVVSGAQTQRGQTIGYSGTTGYSTGPHLHFTVFATQAVKIDTIQSKVCGRPMTLPISPINGYLDPKDYL